MDVHSSGYFGPLPFIQRIITRHSIHLVIYLSFSVNSDPNFSNHQPGGNEGNRPQSKVEIYSTDGGYDGDTVETILRHIRRRTVY